MWKISRLLMVKAAITHFRTNPYGHPHSLPQSRCCVQERPHEPGGAAIPAERALSPVTPYHLSVSHAPMKRWQGDVILQAPLQAAQSPGEPGY